MSVPLTRDDLIDTLETMLEAQLRAVRSLRTGERREGDGQPRRAPKRMSNTMMVEDILPAAGEPLHIGEIIAQAKRDHGVEPKREPIIPPLTKEVLDRNPFRPTGRNVFALLGTGRG